MNTQRTWHKGPPPHIGWWNASGNKRDDIWRWWNGTAWSLAAWPSQQGEWAEDRAKEVDAARMQDLMEWTDYWPENARVPRINPNCPLSVWWKGAMWAVKDGRIVIVSRTPGAVIRSYEDPKVEEAKAVRSINVEDYNEKMDDVVVGAFLRNATTGQLVSELLRRHG